MSEVDAGCIEFTQGPWESSSQRPDWRVTGGWWLQCWDLHSATYRPYVIQQV